MKWLGLKSKKQKKHSNNQPAVHRGEETIEDVREIKNKNGDDAEPLQVDLEPPVEAEEPEVDDHVRERHYAIVWKRDIVKPQRLLLMDPSNAMLTRLQLLLVNYFQGPKTFRQKFESW